MPVRHARSRLARNDRSPTRAGRGLLVATTSARPSSSKGAPTRVGAKGRPLVCYTPSPFRKGLTTRSTGVRVALSSPVGLRARRTWHFERSTSSFTERETCTLRKELRRGPDVPDESVDATPGRDPAVFADEVAKPDEPDEAAARRGAKLVAISRSGEGTPMSITRRREAHRPEITSRMLYQPRTSDLLVGALKGVQAR